MQCFHFHPEQSIPMKVKNQSASSNDKQNSRKEKEKRGTEGEDDRDDVKNWFFRVFFALFPT